MRPKLIYLARRHPELTAESFVSRWRQHGALGMSLPRWKNIWRYAHNDVRRDVSTCSDFDGVGMVWHRSPAARRAHREDRSSQGAMERDELETFDALILRSCALYEEEILTPPPAGLHTKLIRFRVTGEEEVGADDAARRGHILNRRLPPEAGPWGLQYDVIEESWFDDLEAVRAAAARASTLSLIVHEHVLYKLTGECDD